MKYSIIIPHFNDFKSLERLLNSIPSRDDIEIIVIDDKSTDEYDLDSIKSKCIFLNNETSIKSAGTCRNIGLKIAKGKWLLFADSDDVFLNNAFEVFDSYSESVDDIIFFKSKSLIEGSNNVSERNVYLTDLIDKNLNENDESIRYMYFPPWGKLIKHKLVSENEILFDEVIASNDVMFSLKTALFAKKISSVNETVYCVYKRANSLTTTHSKNNRRSRLEVALNRNELLSQYGLKYYQFSFLSIVLNFKDVFTMKLFVKFFKSIVLFRQRMLPNNISIKKIKNFLSRWF
ncbi:glycosyltransferase [Aliivibrio fischeri]|uniref:Glycosyltransferase n=1 Tax=Aliivibrio fischeri TaxID=668 RepID=A0A6N3YXR3_ALIFS|nr:glycosyltransferase family A protein [Aliivibrio fischeri]MUK46089.1 glycosyltransferase [Aliivibrio fischeri]MUK79223.1 glycosyltransferase [Aliivibrio fischeri]MUK85865.1 glycosyltransferase [Aliivibrio fischeri]